MLPPGTDHRTGTEPALLDGAATAKLHPAKPTHRKAAGDHPPGRTEAAKVSGASSDAARLEPAGS